MICLICLTQISHAQDFNVGLKAGLSYGSIIEGDMPKYESNPKLGYVGGLFVSIPIVPLIAIQPEILLSQKGFKSTGTLLGTNYSFSRSTNWVDIPVLLRLKPFPGFALLAGPSVSFLLSHKDEFAINGEVTSSSSEEYKQKMSNNMIGLVAGFDINISKLLIFARYNLDLKKNNSDGSSYIPSYRNQVVQVGVGLKF